MDYMPGYNNSNYNIPNVSRSYGEAELIRLLNNIDKKLYVIIKKLEQNLGQPETDEVLRVGSDGS